MDRLGDARDNYRRSLEMEPLNPELQGLCRKVVWRLLVEALPDQEIKERTPETVEEYRAEAKRYLIRQIKYRIDQLDQYSWVPPGSPGALTDEEIQELKELKDEMASLKDDHH